MNNKKIIYPSFNKELAREMKNKEFKKYFDHFGKQLEVAYKILLLREKRKVSQSQLAKKLKTTQSAVARMESGGQNFTTSMLQKIAEALNCQLKVDFVLREKPKKKYQI